MSKIPTEPTKIATAQRNDTYLGPIVDFITHDGLPLQKTLAKQVLCQAQQFAVIDDLLFHVQTNNRHSQVIIRLAMPAEYTFDILQFFHLNLGTHVKSTKLFDVITNHFYTKNLYKHLHEYARTLCQRSSQTHDTPQNRSIIPQLIKDCRPFAVEHIASKFFSHPAMSTHYCLFCRTDLQSLPLLGH